ncbi:MAG: patatin family protein [Ruminococcaceae bacterium]|nr:patatin family protein [Oscillospiraceae bacterium]
MKKGLIMEGGAMRGMFTAGVTDVMMENGITFDGAIGVSAGAVFGINYKSNQPGRVIRYNTAYCRDKRYCSIRSLIFTGDLYGNRFCYHELPNRLDLFDTETYAASPMEFYAVVTDVDTGEAVYRRCDRWEEDEIEWLRASASMPLASRIIEIEEGGRRFRLLDGGVADSIPIRAFEKMGYDRNVVILTQPLGYIKEKSSALPLIRFAYRKHPRFIEALARRHEMYNETIEYLTRREKEGAVYVIRPSRKLPVNHVEKDPMKLRECYDIGRKCCNVEEIRAFLGE